MREIDEVRIEGSVLTIFDTKGERHRFKMGVPEQVYDEIVRKLGPIDHIDVDFESRTVMLRYATEDHA